MANLGAICAVVQNPAQKYHDVWPVSGAGSAVPAGTLLIPGATGGTNYSILIPTAANSAPASGSGYVGLLAEKHDPAISGDALTATLVDWFAPGNLQSGKTAFPSRRVDLLSIFPIVRMDYSLASTVAVASASSATLTITSFEQNFDGGWVYVNAGTGIGQLLFVASSSSGSCVLTSAATTQLDNTSKLTKVLPHWYTTPVFKVNTTTVPALLDSTAAAGSGRACIIWQGMQQGNIDVRLNPKSYHNTAGLNSLGVFGLYAKLVFQGTIFIPNS